METDKYGQIIHDALSVAENDEDISPTGLELLDNLLYPNLRQRKEFGQQVALTQMQQDFAVSGKMAAAKEVGINPHTMAAGIAGSSAPSASAPNSATGAGAAGVSSLSSLADSASNVASVGVDAADRLSTLSARRDKIKAETIQSLLAAGLDEWQAKAIAEMLPDRKRNLRADTYLKLGQYRNTVAEYRNIRKEYDKKIEEINVLKQQADLLEKQGNLAQAEKLRVEAQTRGIEIDNWWKETDKNFWIEHGYSQDDPLDVSLRNAAANGKDVDVDKIGQSVETFNYDQERGKRDADVDTAFDLYFNEQGGKEAVSADYAPYYAAIQANKQQVIEFFKMLYDNPNDIKGLIGKFVNLVANLGSAIQIDNKGTIVPKKPEIHRK